MSITEFLLARYAEDEAYAHARHLRSCIQFVGGSVCSCDEPARVLADIEAKRVILALHRVTDHSTYRGGPCCVRCTADGEYPADDGYTDEQNWPCPTLRALALPCADRPGYDEAWRP